MTNNKTKSIEQKAINFFVTKNVKLELTQFQAYELSYALHLLQEKYGFNAKNQTPTTLRKLVDEQIIRGD